MKDRIFKQVLCKEVLSTLLNVLYEDGYSVGDLFSTSNCKIKTCGKNPNRDYN